MFRPLALLVSGSLALFAAPPLDVWHSKSEIRSVEPATALKLSGERKGGLYRARLTNTGKTAVHVKEVSLFRIEHDLSDATALYGESF